VTGPLESYLKDASHFRGEADQIVSPASEEAVVLFLKEANRRKTSVTVSGAGTGLTGARVPQQGTVLSTEKLNRILKISWDEPKQEGSAVVQPGVILRDLEQALEAAGLFYPPDPGEKNAFIGGTVATNASGPRSLKYGATRRWVKRLRVVLANGEVLDLRRGQQKAAGKKFEITFPNGKMVDVPVPGYTMPPVKNAAGYYARPHMDLVDLFIGSEGTLGIFTEIELAVIKKPAGFTAGLIFFQSEKDCARFGWEALDALEPRLLEFFDRRSLTLLSGKHPKTPAQAQAALFFEQECAPGSEETVQQTWTTLSRKFNPLGAEPWFSHRAPDLILLREFRHDLPVLVNEQVARNGFRKIGTDLAVPDTHGEAMLDFYLKTLQEAGIDYAIFGHIGENNLHVNLLPKTSAEFERSKTIYDTFAKKAAALGGTVSAEHGIGKVRIPYLEMMVGKEGLRQMARVKQALDPNGILNPGNIFPAELLGPRGE